MKQYRLPILKNEQVSDRYWHIVTDASQIREPIHAGQFFHLLCSEGGQSFLRRPFSIYRHHGGKLEFLYLVKGSGTQEMTQYQPGEELDVIGPLGHGFNLDPDAGAILLVARGVGIATLAALAYEAHEKNVQCIAIMSARSHDDLLATDLLEEYGAIIHKVTEEDGTSDVDNVERLANELIVSHDIKSIYTCGSKRLSRLSQRVAKEKNLQGEIALEEHMGCAMGACYACVCELQEETGPRSVRVCIEGPVFDLDKVVV